MTTITTGTTGPRAWKIAMVAGALGLAAVVAVNLPLDTSGTADQANTETATVVSPSAVSGFDYNSEATVGRVASPGVTSPYTGNSGELFPYENGAAPVATPDQATIDLFAPVITPEFLGTPSEGAAAQRVPQANVSMR